MKQTLHDDSSAMMFPAENHRISHSINNTSSVAPGQTGSKLRRLIFLFFLFSLLVSHAQAQLTRQWVTELYPKQEVQYVPVKTVFVDDGHYLQIGFINQLDSEAINILVQKLDTAGQLLWSRNFDNAPESFRAVAAEVGSTGDVYLLSNTERTDDSMHGQRMHVARLAADGQGEWHTVYEATGISGSDIKLGQDSTLYLTASAPGYSNGSAAAVTRKITASGEVVWEHVAPEAGEGKLAVTSDGSLLLAAKLYDRVLPVPDILFAKLEGATGNQRSSHVYSHQLDESTAHEQVEKILVDDAGAAYVVLSNENTTISAKELALLKIAPTGEIAWTTVFADSYFTFFRDAELRGQDEVWLLGDRQQIRFVPESFVTSISASGEQLWTNTYSTYPEPAHLEQKVFYDLAVDAAGTVAATGFYAEYFVESACCPTSLQGPFLLTALLDGSGNIVAQDTLQDEGSLVGLSLDFDTAGDLYVAGRWTGDGAGTSRNAVAVKYEVGASCNTPASVALSLPPGPHPVGKQIRTTAYLESDSLPERLDPRWNWGNGRTSISYHAPGDRHVTGEHTYTEAGIYPISLDFDQSCLTPVSEDYVQHLVIFDPDAGFVMGNGWFTPVNLPKNIPSHIIRVHFDLDIRYEQNGEGLMPIGTTSFRLTDALRFKSTGYDWLVIKDNQAVWQGSGKINGYGNFGFIVSVRDGGEENAGQADMLRVRIWDKNRGNSLYYDSYSFEDLPYFLPAQGGPAIGDGNIVINRHGRPDRGMVADARDLQAYPNPVSGTVATLRFELKQQGSYSLSLFDLNGVLVQELRQGSAGAAEPVEVQVNTAALSRGMYLARLVTDHEVRSVRIIVQK